ncbi:MAG: hypothetical protein HGA49_01105 [Eubacteriaceae bacterium]|nr:hypothetical protein [Eubacteriaceae bacterium]
MGLIDWLKSKQNETSEVNDSEGKPGTTGASNNITVKLTGSTTKERQKVLETLKGDEVLKTRTAMTRGPLGYGLEVFAPNGGSIGVIPSQHLRYFETKYGSSVKPYIDHYQIAMDQEGFYECEVRLQVDLK